MRSEHNGLEVKTHGRDEAGQLDAGWQPVQLTLFEPKRVVLYEDA